MCIMSVMPCHVNHVRQLLPWCQDALSLSKCRCCNLQMSRSGEPAVQCAICTKHWHASCADRLCAALMKQSVIASFREGHGSLLRGLRNCVKGSVGMSSVWDALIGVGHGSSSGTASSSSSTPAHAERTRFSPES